MALCDEKVQFLMVKKSWIGLFLSYPVKFVLLSKFYYEMQNNIVANQYIFRISKTYLKYIKSPLFLLSLVNFNLNVGENENKILKYYTYNFWRNKKISWTKTKEVAFLICYIVSTAIVLDICNQNAQNLSKRKKSFNGTWDTWSKLANSKRKRIPR